MLQGAHSSVHKPSDSDLEKSRDAALAIAISPLAIPILAGPGTIATAMNFASASGITTLLITIGAFAILCLITYVSFVSGERMIKYLGENAVNAITRLMGLILATIGTQIRITSYNVCYTKLLRSAICSGTCRAACSSCTITS